MKELPSTRFYASCKQAIKELAPNIPDYELKKIPIDDDELRVFLKKELGLEKYNEIISKTKEIMTLKKRDDKNEEIDKRFFQINLLEEIYKELDKDHKLDEKEKLALFIVRLTAELKNSNDRVSAALKGDSSAGKDNTIKTILKHFPKEDNFFLTRGTASAIEDEASKVKCIAFSEINKHRENGANNEITETFKQLSEGGVSVIKKDAATGFRTTKKSESKQLTLIYGTTETESDEELETRYVIIPIKGTTTKNRVVVEDVIDRVSDFNKFDKEKESWISAGIRQLDNELDVVIPYAKILKEKITLDGKERFFFDYRKERIKRDVKRLFSLTKAVAWIYQKQRNIKTYNGISYIISEPTDLFFAAELFTDFFNLTYTGLDHRLQKCYDTIKKLEGKHDKDIMDFKYPTQYYGWVLRHKLQEDLGIQNIKTIRKYITALKDFCMIETFYSDSIPRGYLIRGCYQGSNRVSVPVTITPLTPYLQAILTPYFLEKWYNNKSLSSINSSFLWKNSVSNDEIDTLQIDTLNLQEDTYSNDEKIYHKCKHCGRTPCVDYNNVGQPVCELCVNKDVKVEEISD